MNLEMPEKRTGGKEDSNFLLAVILSWFLNGKFRAKKKMQGHASEKCRIEYLSRAKSEKDSSLTEQPPFILGSETYREKF